MEELNKNIRDGDLFNEKRMRYITKEQFISMIQELNFTFVKDVELTCVTGFKICENDKGNKYVECVGFDIRIN